jgi:hypothetical protein
MCNFPPVTLNIFRNVCSGTGRELERTYDVHRVANSEVCVIFYVIVTSLCYRNNTIVQSRSLETVFISSPMFPVCVSARPMFFP